MSNIFTLLVDLDETLRVLDSKRREALRDILESTLPARTIAYHKPIVQAYEKQARELITAITVYAETNINLLRRYPITTERIHVNIKRGSPVLTWAATGEQVRV